MAFRLHKSIAMSDQGMLFNPVSGESFSTNETGLRVIKLLNEGMLQHEILEVLALEYEIENEFCERDLSDFFDMLKHFQLIANYE
jgi:hypothetical protein